MPIAGVAKHLTARYAQIFKCPIRAASSTKAVLHNLVLLCILFGAVPKRQFHAISVILSVQSRAPEDCLQPHSCRGRQVVGDLPQLLSKLAKCFPVDHTCVSSLRWSLQRPCEDPVMIFSRRHGINSEALYHTSILPIFLWIIRMYEYHVYGNDLHQQ